VTTPTELHDALLILLRTIGTVTVFDGDVPDKPTADTSGRVYPYVVVWATPGYYPSDDADTVCAQPGGELTWPVQLTVAAGTPAWCLEAAGTVRAKIAGALLVPAAGPLREDNSAVPVVKDTGTAPPRWYVPLLYRTQTA
jgi:hypothetical protein